MPELWTLGVMNTRSLAFLLVLGWIYGVHAGWSRVPELWTLGHFMNTPPDSPQKPSGYDSGLKCLTAVFIFTVAVSVILPLANKSGSRAIIGTALIAAFFGLIALVVASCIVWSRRATSPRPARRWALVVAIVWASIQILGYLFVVLQIL